MAQSIRTSLRAQSQKDSFSSKVLESMHYYCCCYWCWCCPERKPEDWDYVPDGDRGRRPLVHEANRDFGSTLQKSGRPSQVTAQQPLGRGLSRTTSSRPAEAFQMKEIPFQMPPLRQTSIITRDPPTPSIAIQHVQWDRPPQPAPRRQTTSRNDFSPLHRDSTASKETNLMAGRSSAEHSPAHSPSYHQRSKRNSSVFSTSPAPSIASTLPSRRESVEPEYARYLSVVTSPGNDAVEASEDCYLLPTRAQSNLDVSSPISIPERRRISTGLHQTRQNAAGVMPSMRKAASQNVLGERDRSDSKKSDASVSNPSQYATEDYIHGVLRGILEYDVHNKRIKFTLGKVENLPMRNEVYDVCVRFSMHPSKKEMQKTSRFLKYDAVEKDPGYNEVFQFDCNNPEKKHLMAVVCQPKTGDKHDFIASGDINLEKIFRGGVHGYSTSIGIQLRRFLHVPELRVGKLLVSLAYDTTGGSLTLELIRVQDILTQKGDAPTTYFKVLHLRKGTRIQKTHSKSVARQKNPEFQEKLIFKLPPEFIDHTMFVLILREKTLLKKDVELGRCYIGPYQYVEGNKLTTYGRATVMQPYRATRWHWLFN